MTWHRGHREDVREFLAACLGPDWPGRGAQAQRLLDRLPDEVPVPRGAPAAAPVPHGRIDKSTLAFPPPSGGPSKRERRAERLPEIRRIRIAVQRRARGRCEFLCLPASEPCEAHHVLGGSDRVAQESEHSVSWICEPCHDKCNASPAWAREQGFAWATRQAVAAKAAGDAAAAEGFQATADALEARIGLAAAQAKGGERA